MAARTGSFLSGFVCRQALAGRLELGSSQQKPDRMPWDGDGQLEGCGRLIRKELLLLAS